VPAIADDARSPATSFAVRDAPTYYGWFNGKLFFNMLAQATDASADPDSPMPKFSTAKIWREPASAI